MELLLHTIDGAGNPRTRRESVSYYLVPIISRKEKEVFPQKLILLEEGEKLIRIEASCQISDFERKIPCEKLPAEFEEISFASGWVPIAKISEEERFSFSYATNEWLPHTAE